MQGRGTVCWFGVVIPTSTVGSSWRQACSVGCSPWCHDEQRLAPTQRIQDSTWPVFSLYPALASGPFNSSYTYRFALQDCVSSKLWPSVRMELWQVRGFLPLLIADVGAPNCEIVSSQDAAGPNAESCPTGGFCRGFATPPIDQAKSILSRREVRGRRHFGPDALPVELRPATTTAKSEAPEVEARWPSDRPRYKPGTYDEVAQAGAAELPSDWKTLHRTVLPA